MDCGEAIPFSLESVEGFSAAADRAVAALDGSVEVLGLGEPLHGGDEFLVLRNRLFERLVEAHGYSAIAVESSFPQSLIVDDYVVGAGASSFDDVKERGFSHGFGRLAANRELVEWMRRTIPNPRIAGPSASTVSTLPPSPIQPRARVRR